jgi:hypothetical protein
MKEIYFTTPEQGIEIVRDALNAGWKHNNGASFKDIKQDIKAVMKANGTEKDYRYIYGVEEDESTMIFTVFLKVEKKKK